MYIKLQYVVCRGGGGGGGGGGAWGHCPYAQHPLAMPYALVHQIVEFSNTSGRYRAEHYQLDTVHSSTTHLQASIKHV